MHLSLADAGKVSQSQEQGRKGHGAASGLDQRTELDHGATRKLGESCFVAATSEFGSSGAWCRCSLLIA